MPQTIQTSIVAMPMAKATQAAAIETQFRNAQTADAHAVAAAEQYRIQRTMQEMGPRPVTGGMAAQEIQGLGAIGSVPSVGSSQLIAGPQRKTSSVQSGSEPGMLGSRRTVAGVSLDDAMDIRGGPGSLEAFGVNIPSNWTVSPIGGVYDYGETLLDGMGAFREILRPYLFGRKFFQAARVTYSIVKSKDGRVVVNIPATEGNDGTKTIPLTDKTAADLNKEFVHWIEQVSESGVLDTISQDLVGRGVLRSPDEVATTGDKRLDKVVFNLVLFDSEETLWLELKQDLGEPTAKTEKAKYDKHAKEGKGNTNGWTYTTTSGQIFVKYPSFELHRMHDPEAGEEGRSLARAIWIDLLTHELSHAELEASALGGKADEADNKDHGPIYTKIEERLGKMFKDFLSK